MSNEVKAIEDYLCDLCDLSFDDGIVCDKVFNQEEPVNRAAFITQQGGSVTDQDGMRLYTAQILENRKTRSECIIDMGIIDKHFRKYRKKIDNGLVINMSVSYIISPTKMIIGTENAYFLSANIEIKVT